MVTVDGFDGSLHTGAVSKGGGCGQGGTDTCQEVPVFSVVGEHYNVASCDKHLAGAVRQALGLSRRSSARS